MADQCPEKKEIEQIFNRLRSISANKVCFDCNAKNPTWASVTYGVFICIDCSAVHRSLGVHLTFVRSTQLDTNWTWLQMRQMQLGGNANASQFFRQHNCNSNDSQQKYNSRVASMYRDKLRHLAQQAMNTYGTQLFIDSNNEPAQVEEKEPNFFEDVADEFNSNVPEPLPLPSLQKDVKLQEIVKTSENTTSERKPTIGVRKVQPKRSGLGAKKGGLGATKVSTNFADIEREANLVQQRREQAAENYKQEVALQKEDEEKAIINMRLAYKDLSVQQTKEEERLKAVDPKKAQQVERLGMGFAKSRSGVSHSALNDMKTIEQENLDKGTSSFSASKSSFEKDSDGFFDDFSFSSNNMYDRSGERHIQSLMDSRSNTKHDWEIIEPETNNRSVHTMFNPEIKTQPKPIKGACPEDAAQKKFGNVKAISSDQYFNDGTPEYERNANMNRFQGSNSISSADYFGDGSGNKRGGSSYTSQQLQNLDLDDVKQSVRQGVSKVAGKLSSLANGVMTTLQDKYGY